MKANTFVYLRLSIGLLGLGSFTLSTAQQSRFGPDSIFICQNCQGAWRFADVDGNGTMDALVGDSVYINNGSADFAPNPAWIPPGLPYDMNNDGLLDMVSDSGWAKNNGAGYDPIVTNGFAGAKNHMVDFDNDGHLDRLALREDTNLILLALNLADGSGNFQPVQTFLQMGEYLEFLTPFDWNGDGNLDVMALLDTTGAFGVSLNFNGTLGSAFTYVGSDAVAHRYSNVSGRADHNADGLADYRAGHVMYTAFGTGLMVPWPATFWLDDLPMDVANVDCDAEEELVFTNLLEMDIIQLMQFSGDPLFFLEETDPVYLAHLSQPERNAVEFVDLDGDSVADLVFSHLFNLQFRLNRAAEPAVMIDLTDVPLSSAAVFELPEQPDWPGGFFTGPGIFDNMFYAALAVPLLSGSLEVPVEYHYQDAVGCAGIGRDTLYLYDDVGILETELNAVHVYPNPASGSIHVVAEAAGAGSVRILDAIGRVRKEIGATFDGYPVEIMLDGLEAGSFLLEVGSSDGAWSRTPFVHRPVQ